MNSTDLPAGAELRDFLMLTYSELEDLNLRAKAQRQERVPLERTARRTFAVPRQRASDQGAHGAL